MCCAISKLADEYKETQGEILILVLPVHPFFSFLFQKPHPYPHVYLSQARSTVKKNLFVSEDQYQIYSPCFRVLLAGNKYPPQEPGSSPLMKTNTNKTLSQNSSRKICSTRLTSIHYFVQCAFREIKVPATKCAVTRALGILVPLLPIFKPPTN